MSEPVRCKATRAIRRNGKTYEAGAVLDLPVEDARKLAASGAVVAPEGLSAEDGDAAGLLAAAEDEIRALQNQTRALTEELDRERQAKRELEQAFEQAKKQAKDLAHELASAKDKIAALEKKGNKKR